MIYSCSSSKEDPNRKVKIDYPKTKKIDVVDKYFGHEVVDPYRWLEDDMSKDEFRIAEKGKVWFRPKKHFLRVKQSLSSGRYIR